MIYTAITKRSFGITLFGDFNDLDKLYKVIHHCADCYQEGSGAKGHLQFIAYEIRHAKLGKRERKVLKSDSGDNHIYYSTSFALPY